MKRSFKSILFLLGILFCDVLCAQSVDKEVIAFQMNSCRLSTTNLVSDNGCPNLIMYNREYDKLENCLSRLSMSSIPEIRQLRELTYDKIGEVQITEEERRLLQKVHAMDRKNAKWQALSSGLGNAMFFIPVKGGVGPQAAFYTLVSAARTTVDFCASQGAADIEEMKSMWEVRKKYLNTKKELMSEQNKLINNIFQIYRIPDEYMVKGRSAKHFNEIISIKNPEDRKNKLEAKKKDYQYLNDFYYHLGMAYFEMGENMFNKKRLSDAEKLFSTADHLFDTYIANEKKAQVYSTDDMLGCIYLAKLAMGKRLDKSTIELYINQVMKNLPTNSAAYVQCASTYICQLKSPEKAFELLNKALNDVEVLDKELIVYSMSKWMSEIKGTQIFRKVCNTMAHSISSDKGSVSLNSYLCFLISTGDSNMWRGIGKLMKIQGKLGGIDLNGDFRVIFPDNVSIDKRHMSIYTESLHGDELKVVERKLLYPEGVTREKLMKFDLIKDHEELISILFDYEKNADLYYVKLSVIKEYDKLMNRPYDFPGMAVFEETLSVGEGEKNHKQWMKIVDFCKEQKNHVPKVKKILCTDGGKKSVISGEMEYIDNYYERPSKLTLIGTNKFQKPSGLRFPFVFQYKAKLFKGGVYRPYFSTDMDGDFVHVQFYGRNTDPISVIFRIENGKAILFAVRTADRMIFRMPRITKKPHSAKMKS